MFYVVNSDIDDQKTRGRFNKTAVRQSTNEKREQSLDPWTIQSYNETAKINI